MGWRMRWVDTTALGRSGFVQARLMQGHTGYNLQTLAEVSRHGATYWLDFTRFAPKDAQTDHQREFMSLESAKAYALAMVVLS